MIMARPALGSLALLRRVAGQGAAGERAVGDRPVAHIVEGAGPAGGGLVEHQEAVAVEAEALGAEAIHVHASVEEAGRVAGLADIAAGADDQLRGTLASEGDRNSVRV